LERQNSKRRFVELKFGGETPLKLPFGGHKVFYTQNLSCISLSLIGEFIVELRQKLKCFVTKTFIQRRQMDEWPVFAVDSGSL
jgi:hypothetical protein